MKKILTLAAIATFAAAAIAGIQSMDARVPAGKVVEAVPSREAASVPVEVRVAGAQPNSGTLTLTTIHVLADGTPTTNTVASVGGTNGVYAIASAPYVLRGGRLVFTFSAVTNGNLTAVFDIKD